MKSVISIKVRYSETDKMGIVHHSRYYPWFEVGRVDLMERLCISYDGLEQDGLMMPLSESHCRYVKPCTFGDTVTLETVVTDVTAARCTFGYTVYKDGELIASGSTVHAFADRQLRVINIRKKYPQLWNTLNDASEVKKDA